MNPNLIPPVYFPTTVVFVDDNTDFLSNLSLQLNPTLSFKLYDSPSEALAACNGIDSQSTDKDRYFSHYYHSYNPILARPASDVNREQAHYGIYNEGRFEQISVAVVDYDMPNIDGIEFCKRINNPAIKKILLTGQADEKIAVQAFNHGIIDYFILKQDKDVIDTLNQAIVELQHAYFIQTEQLLGDLLPVCKHFFLRDPQLYNAFKAICAELQIVEFYQCTTPSGLLMLNAQGESSLLIVMNEDAMTSQYEIALDQQAPPALLEALESNRVVPYFWKTEGYYSPECNDWQACLFPATECNGYLYGVINNPPKFNMETVLSYNAFLDKHDKQCCSFA